MARGKKEVEEMDETFLVEQTDDVAPIIIEEKVIEKPIVSVEIDNSKTYRAEVIQNFGKTLKGSIIEKKGSIIKVLLEKKLVKII